MTNQFRGRANKSAQVPQELLAKIPPQDIELEKAVLGAILLQPESLHDVSALLQSEIFYKEENRLVYDAITGLVHDQSKVDVLTVADRLKKSGNYKTIGGAKYLAELASKISGAAHIEMHVRILVEKWLKRSLIYAGSKMVMDAYDESTDPFDILTDAEKIISGANDHITGNDEATTASTVDRVVEVLFRKNETGAAQEGILTSGFLEIDQRMAGWVAPDFTIVGARPSMGKSTLAYTAIRNLCEKGIPVGMVTLEVNRDQVIQKLISLVSRVPFRKFRRKEEITNEEWARIHEAAGKIRKWPLHLDETCDNILKFRLKVASWKRKFGVQFVILDYLQLMSGGSKSYGNRDADLGEVSRGIKKSCRELNLPILALAQLSRKVEERSDKMPHLADLRESGNLEQDADNVMFLMRPEFYGFQEFASMENNSENWDVKGLAVVNMAKNRHGEIGYFPLHFNGAISEFSNSKYTRITTSENQIPLGFDAKSPADRINEFDKQPDSDNPF